MRLLSLSTFRDSTDRKDATDEKTQQELLNKWHCFYNIHHSFCDDRNEWNMHDTIFATTLLHPPSCVWWLKFSLNIHQNCGEEGEGEEGSIRFGGAGHWHPLQVKIIRLWERPESTSCFIFRQHQMVGREGKGGHSFLAIDHIRDQLIPPQVRHCSGDQCQYTVYVWGITRKGGKFNSDNSSPFQERSDKAEVWSKAVAYIRTHESRVRMMTTTMMTMTTTKLMTMMTMAITLDILCCEDFDVNDAQPREDVQQWWQWWQCICCVVRILMSTLPRCERMCSTSLERSSASGNGSLILLGNLILLMRTALTFSDGNFIFSIRTFLTFSHGNLIVLCTFVKLQLGRLGLHLPLHGLQWDLLQVWEALRPQSLLLQIRWGSLIWDGWAWLFSSSKLRKFGLQILHVNPWC